MRASEASQEYTTEPRVHRKLFSGPCEALGTRMRMALNVNVGAFPGKGSPAFNQSPEASEKHF